jgi:hypothetical protein
MLQRPLSRVGLMALANGPDVSAEKGLEFISNSYGMTGKIRCEGRAGEQ